MRRLFALSISFAVPAAAQMSPPVPPANPPTNCTALEHRQFDFWVGEWEVYQTAKPEEMAGVSLIERVYNGCGIRENWKPFSLYDGGSLSSYDTRERVWRQTWLDSGNARVDLTGHWDGSRMVLTGLWRDLKGPGKDGLMRITYSPEPGPAVRQIGETSMDGGKSWSPSFDFTYRPRRKPPDR